MSESNGVATPATLLEGSPGLEEAVRRIVTFTLGKGDGGPSGIRHFAVAVKYHETQVQQLITQTTLLAAEVVRKGERIEELERELAAARASARPRAVGVVYGIGSDKAATARNADKRAIPKDLRRWFLLGPYIDHVALDDDEVASRCDAYAEALAFAEGCGLPDYIPIQAAFARAYVSTGRRVELRSMAHDTALALERKLPEAATGAYCLGEKYRRFEVAGTLDKPGTMGLLFGSALCAIHHDVVKDPSKGGKKKGITKVGSQPTILSLRAEDDEWLARAERAASPDT